MVAKAAKAKAELDLSGDRQTVVRYAGPHGDLVVAASDVELQDKGVVFQTSEPKESGGEVRHVVFVPYSSLVDIRQDYVA
jgi:hypothetical protein